MPGVFLLDISTLMTGSSDYHTVCSGAGGPGVHVGAAVEVVGEPA